MKAIQITFEEDLLNDLDADETVKEIGRSALLRQLAREYLRRERERRIDEQYAPCLRRQGRCGSREGGLGRGR